MISALASEPIPLSTDSDGVVRIGGTRVTLETFVDVFDAGATPEEIARDFPVLQIADIYAVSTYYLRHREEVQRYLAKRWKAGAAIRERVGVDQRGLRETLLARLGRDV